MIEKKIKILHVANLRTDITNGPLFSVPNKVRYLNKYGSYAHNLLDLSFEKNKPHYQENTDFHHLSLANEYIIQGTTNLSISKYHLIIFHEFYQFKYLKMAKLCRKKNIPYIIVPRGSIDKDAKNHKKLKKKIADIVFFDRFLNSSSGIVFLTSGEAKNGVFKRKKNFKVIPNGVAIQKLNVRKKVRRIVYLGRLNIFTKGLDTLVDTFSCMNNFLRDNKIKIELYGSDTPKNDKKQIEEMIKDNNLSSSISIMDPVYGPDKNNVLSSADLFITLSRHEGLPVSILEALSYGLPVAITPETNLSKEVKDYDSGIILGRDPKANSQQIEKMIKQSVETYSNNAFKLIKNEFSWQIVAGRFDDYISETLAKNNFETS